MPLLKKSNRQPDQVVKQAGADLKVQDVLYNQNDQRADRTGGNFNRGK